MTNVTKLQAALAYQIEQLGAMHQSMQAGRYDHMSAPALRKMICIRIGALCDARIALQLAQQAEEMVAA